MTGEISAAFTAASPPAWVEELGGSALVWQARGGVFRQVSA